MEIGCSLKLHCLPFNQLRFATGLGWKSGDFICIDAVGRRSFKGSACERAPAPRLAVCCGKWTERGKCLLRSTAA